MLAPSSSNRPSVFPNLRNRAKPSMAEEATAKTSLGAPSDRIPPITGEQDGRVPATPRQVSFDRLGFIRLQWMLARVAALQAMNHDAQCFEIEVLDTQQSDLTGAQTMAVGEQKDRFVASMRGESMEQAGSFPQREKFNGVCAHRGHPSEAKPNRFCSK